MGWFSKHSLSVKIMLVLGATFTLVSILNILWIGQKQKNQAMESATVLAREVSDQTLGALNNLMILGSMDEKSSLLKIISKAEGINDVRVIRSKSVNDQYGEGGLDQKPQTEAEIKVLATGEPEYVYKDAELHAVVPFLLEENWRGINCFDCHEGKAGAAIGALVVSISMKKVEATASRNNRFLMIFFLIEGLALLAISYFLIAQRLSSEINEVAGALTNGSHEVGSTAANIGNSSSSLAQCSTDLKGSVQQTRNSLSGIIDLINTSNKDSSKVGEFIKEVEKLIENGLNSVKRTVTAMEAINESSKKVGAIIKIIEDIAFQTNLLALNAAVEAARAGESGKGFAVVAEEVRNLAQKVSAAAKETNSFLGEASTNSENGVQVVDETYNSLVRIHEGIGEVNASVEKLEQNANEQTSMVSDVTRDMKTLDQVSQSASSNADLTASIAEKLSDQSDNLQSLVGRLIEIMEGRR